MTFKNTLPIQCICAYCHEKQWSVMTDTWEPYVPVVGNIVIKKGTCTDCEKKWQSEEARVNDQLRADMPRLTKKNHRGEPRRTKPGTDKRGATACSSNPTTSS